MPLEFTYMSFRRIGVLRMFQGLFQKVNTSWVTAFWSSSTTICYHNSEETHFSNDSYFKGWRAWRIYVSLTFFLLSRRYKQVVCIKSCTYFIFPLSKDVSLITWHKVDILKINNSTKFVSFCSFRIDKLTKVTWWRI